MPQDIVLNRAKHNELSLPNGHKLLLHQTVLSENYNNGGVTYFLCIGNDDRDYLKNKPYVVWHRFMPGLHINYGFFISIVDLSLDSILPDKHSKIYVEHLFANLKSSGTFEMLFSAFLERVSISLSDLIQPHLRYAAM